MMPPSLDPPTHEAAPSAPVTEDLAAGDADGQEDLLVAVPCPLCGSDRHRELFRKTGHFWNQVKTRELSFAVNRCSGCGLDHVNPRLRPDLLAHHYAAHDLYVDLRGPQLAARRAYFAETLDAIEAACREPSGEDTPRRLLDVACSEGTFIALARERGWETEGIEISAPAAAHGRDILGLPIRTGRLEDTHYPDAAFDIVTVQSFLEHSEDPVRLLTEVRRVLRPGGLLYANVCNGRSLAARLAKANWYNYDPVVHLNYFSPATLRRLARTAGLTAIRVRSRGLGARFFQTAVTDSAASRRIDAWYTARGHSLPGLIRAKRWLSAGLSALGLGQTLIICARRPAS
ncbi:MAG: class I SAM-dependent methyltransferase [Acidobacteriota bacterium]